MIFISHSSKDNEFSERLAKDLQTHDISVWMDTLSIEADSDWTESIQNGLRESDVCIVIWSKKSVISTEVLLEVSQAKTWGKRIIQILIEDCKPPSIFERLQSIDFRRNYDDAREKLFSVMSITRRKDQLKRLEGIWSSNPYPEIPSIPNYK